MKRTMTAGPIATAASVLGATLLTANPIALDVKDSSTMSPANLANRSGFGFSPAIGYTTAPNARGKKAPTGNSAQSFAAR